MTGDDRQTAKEKLLQTQKEQSQAVENLATNAGKRLMIFSHALEPALYNQVNFITACKELVLRHQQCYIKVLIQNNEALHHQDHRFISLMQRLPSRIELKLCHEDYRSHPETFMLADFNGVFFKRTPGKSTATVHINSPRLNDQYSRFFTSVWDQSDFDITFRRLSL